MRRRRSLSVTLTIVAGMAAAGCTRRPDPCDAASFDPQDCQKAIQNGGYYYHGTWIPMTYSHPYPYYYDGYRSYVLRGGRSAPSEGISVHPGPVSRGGFGHIGAGHSSGA